MKYLLTGIVERKYVDTISLTVQAESLTQARGYAKAFLRVYPEVVDGDEVTRAYVEDREYLETKVISLQEQEKNSA